MEKKSKKSLIIGITSLVLTTIILLGLTYAYYRTRIIGNDSIEPSISSSTKKMKIKYTDGSATLSTEGNIEPGFFAEKRFSVTNVGTEVGYFSIIVDNVINEFNKGSVERGEYFDWSYEVFKIENISGTETYQSIKSGDITFDTRQVLIDSVSIESETVNNYKIIFAYKKLDVDQSNDMGSKFSLRVNIDDENAVYTWDEAPQGSLLYLLRTNQPSGTEETVPGKAQSTENEARIVTAEDDYGTSYVYRGNVTNNYVTYSNMCWRVLRVQGDGTIKLVLADESNPCSSGNYSTTNKMSSFINSGTEYAYSSNSSVIFENSNAETVLKQWFDNKITDKTNLTTTEWCNDTSVANIYPGFRTEYSGYSSRKLYGSNSATPSLKCDFTGLELDGVQTSSTKYVGNISLLTADEIHFAGNGKNTYLYKNAENDEDHHFIWTITPESIHSGTPCMFFMDVGFVVASEIGVGTKGPLRPVIAIKSDVDASVKSDIATYGQVGTHNNPYVIG